MIRLIEYHEGKAGIALGFNLPVRATEATESPFCPRIVTMPRRDEVALREVIPLHLYMLDMVFYAAKVCTVAPIDTPSMGERFAKQRARDRNQVQAGTNVAPSTVNTLIGLSTSNLYTTRPPHMAPHFDETTPQFYTAWHKGLQAAQPYVEGDLPEYIPVATVEWDNQMLRWPRDHDPARIMCAEGPNCAAMELIGAPGPLPAYYNPGASNDVAAGSYCLLCIREDIEGLVKHAEHMSHKCGRGARIQPPFKNVVGCPGGYNASACSVVPGRQQAFSGAIHIVGTSGKLQVQYSTKEGVLFVDQSRIMFDPLRDIHDSGMQIITDRQQQQHPFLG